jgi:SAM-dependent methyltransferase
MTAAQAAYVPPALLPVAATLLALAGIRTGETVVDAGCGAGLLTHPAAAAAGPDGRVYGVDPDPALLAAARARRASAVSWVRADPARLPFAGRSVDKLLCAGVSRGGGATVADWAAEWARVLAAGGRVAACAWGEFAVDGPEEAVRRAVRDATGADAAEPDAGDLPHLLRMAGLRVVHETEGAVVVPFESAAAWAAWRLAFPRAAAALGGPAAAAVAARVAEEVGDRPVHSEAVVRYVTATPG